MHVSAHHLFGVVQPCRRTASLRCQELAVDMITRDRRNVAVRLLITNADFKSLSYMAIMPNTVKMSVFLPRSVRSLPNCDCTHCDINLRPTKFQQARQCGNSPLKSTDVPGMINKQSFNMNTTQTTDAFRAIGRNNQPLLSEYRLPVGRKDLRLLVVCKKVGILNLKAFFIGPAVRVVLASCQLQ